MPRPCVSSTLVVSTASPRLAAPLVSRPARLRPLARAIADAEGARVPSTLVAATDPPLVFTGSSYGPARGPHRLRERRLEPADVGLDREVLQPISIRRVAPPQAFVGRHRRPSS